MSETNGEPPHYEDNPAYYENKSYAERDAAMWAWNNREIIRNEEALEREKQEDARAAIMAWHQRKLVREAQGDAQAPPASRQVASTTEGPARPSQQVSMELVQPASTSTLNTGASQGMHVTTKTKNQPCNIDWKKMHERWTAQLKRNLHGLNRARKISDRCKYISDVFSMFPDWSDMKMDTKAVYDHITSGVYETELQIKKAKRDKKNEVKYCRAILKNIEEAMAGGASSENFDRLVAIERRAQADTQVLCHVLPGKITLNELRMDIEYKISLEDKQSAKSRKRDETYEIPPESADESDREIDEKYGNESEDGMQDPESGPDAKAGESGDESSEAEFLPKQKPKGPRQTTGFKSLPSKQQEKKKSARPQPTSRRTRATSSQAPGKSPRKAIEPSTEQVVAALAAPRMTRAAARVAAVQIKKSAMSQKPIVIEADEDADDESDDHDGEYDSDEDAESDTAATDKPEEPAQTQEPIVIESDKGEDDESDYHEDEVQEPEKPQNPIVIESDEDAVPNSDNQEAEAKEPTNEPEQTAPEQPAKEREQPAEIQNPIIIESDSEKSDKGDCSDRMDVESDPSIPTAKQSLIVVLRIKGKGRPDAQAYLAAGFSEAPADYMCPSSSGTYFRSSVAGRYIPPDLPKIIKIRPSTESPVPKADTVEPEILGIGPFVDILRIGSLTQTSMPKAKTVKAKTAKAKPAAIDSDESEVDESKKAPAKKTQPFSTSTMKRGAAKEPDAEKAAPPVTSVPTKTAAPKKVGRAANRDTDKEQSIPIKAAPRSRRGTTPGLAQTVLKPQLPIQKIKKEIKEPENRFQLTETKNSNKGRDRSASTSVVESSTQAQPPKQQVKKETKAPENRYQLNNVGPKKNGRGRSASTDVAGSSDQAPPPKPLVKKVLIAPENRYQLTTPGTNDMGRTYGRSTRAATRQLQDDEYKALTKIGYEGQPDDERAQEEREDHGLPAQNEDKPATRKKRKVVIESSDDEVAAPPPKKKKGNGRKNAIVIPSSDNEEDKDVPAAPKKKAEGPRRPVMKKGEPKKLFGDKAEKTPLQETSGNAVKTVPSPPDKVKEKKVAPAPAVKGKKKQVAPAPQVVKSSKAQDNAQVAASKNAHEVVPNKVETPKESAKQGASDNAVKPVPAPPDKGKEKQVTPAPKVAESSKAQADAQESVPRKGATVTGPTDEGEVPLQKTPTVPVIQDDGPQMPVIEPKTSNEPTPAAAPEPKETAAAPAEPVPRKKYTFGEYLSRFGGKAKQAGLALVSKKEIERGASKLSDRRRQPYHDSNIPVYDAKILDVPSPISEASEPPTPAKAPISIPALAPIFKNGTPGEVVQTPTKQGEMGATLTTTPMPNTPLKRSSLANEIRADESKKPQSPKAAGKEEGEKAQSSKDADEKDGEKPQTPKATDQADDKEEGEISDSSSPKILKRPQEDTPKKASRSSRVPPPLKMSGSETTPVLNYGEDTKDTRAIEKPRVSQKRNAKEFDEDNVTEDPLIVPKRRKSLSPVRRSSKRSPR